MTTDEDRVRRLLHAAAPDLDGVSPQDVARGRSSRSTVLLVAAAVLVVLALAVAVDALHRAGTPTRAAGTPTATAPRPTPTTSTVPLTDAQLLARAATCQDRFGLAAPGLRRGVTATRRQLDSFRPVAAVQCTTAERDYADGTWEVWLLQVSTDPLGPLVTALGQPAPPRPGKSYACAANIDGPPDLALVDARGGFLRPTYPRDWCGHYRSSAAARISSELTWHTVDLRKIQLDIPRDPVKRTCQTAWKDMIDIAAPYAKLSRWRVPPSTGSAIVCLYHRTNDPIAGEYVRGRRVDGGELAHLVGALAFAGRPGSCPSQRDFAVLHDGNAITYVELGGCWRVLRADGTLGRADPAITREILGT